jgi:hypothetical protein
VVKVEPAPELPVAPVGKNQLTKKQKKSIPDTTHGHTTKLQVKITNGLNAVGATIAPPGSVASTTEQSLTTRKATPNPLFPVCPVGSGIAMAGPRATVIGGHFDNNAGDGVCLTGADSKAADVEASGNGKATQQPPSGK